MNTYFFLILLNNFELYPMSEKKIVKWLSMWATSHTSFLHLVGPPYLTTQKALDRWSTPIDSYWFALIQTRSSQSRDKTLNLRWAVVCQPQNNIFIFSNTFFLLLTKTTQKLIDNLKSNVTHSLVFRNLSAWLFHSLTTWPLFFIHPLVQGRGFLPVISIGGCHRSTFRLLMQWKCTARSANRKNIKIPHVVYPVCLGWLFTQILLDFHSSNSIDLCGQLCFFVVCGKADFLLAQHKLQCPCVELETESLDQENKTKQKKPERTAFIKEKWNKTIKIKSESYTHLTRKTVLCPQLPTHPRFFPPSGSPAQPSCNVEKANIQTNLCIARVKAIFIRTWYFYYLHPGAFLFVCCVSLKAKSLYFSRLSCRCLGLP